MTCWQALCFVRETLAHGLSVRMDTIVRNVVKLLVLLMRGKRLVKLGHSDVVCIFIKAKGGELFVIASGICLFRRRSPSFFDRPRLKAGRSRPPAKYQLTVECSQIGVLKPEATFPLR